MTAIKQLSLLSSVLLLLVSFCTRAEIAEAIKVDKNHMGLDIFNGPDVKKYTDDYGASAASLSKFVSSDKKFYTGLYQSGPVMEQHLEQDYGDDEFMVILSGSITLKSISGKVTVLNPGDAVSLPKEWRGTWHSEGYTKLWVIYNPAYAESE